MDGRLIRPAGALADPCDGGGGGGLMVAMGGGGAGGANQYAAPQLAWYAPYLVAWYAEHPRENYATVRAYRRAVNVYLVELGVRTSERRQARLIPLAFFSPRCILLFTMPRETDEADKRGYAFIRRHVLLHGCGPTLRAINEVTGRSSPRSAILTLRRLEKAGLIKRNGSSIKLVSADTSANQSIATIDVPLVGSIAAGCPMLADENIQAVIPVSTAIVRPGCKYFLLRVVGDSMDRAKVQGNAVRNGSLLVVRQQPTAESGAIVVALINDEATVKILERAGALVILRPKSSNRAHQPILLTDNCRIQGEVIAVLPAEVVN